MTAAKEEGPMSTPARLPEQRPVLLPWRRGDGKPQLFHPRNADDNPLEDARCVVEEAFGHILPLLRYRDIDDVVARG